MSNFKPTIVTTELNPEAAIEAARKYLSAACALVISNSYEAEALMRFTSTVSYTKLSSK